MATNRRGARELLMKLVYQMSVMDNWDDSERDDFLVDAMNDPQSEHIIKDKADRAYFASVFDAVRDHKGEIDAMIDGASSNWKFARIAKVDLAIMRIAIAEILYADDIPLSVSINEAVELAKKFGGEKSHEFVNGVLGKIGREE